ncbi:MAG TPA: 5-(carboxyamino)imidazole ribonucleotide mutase [Firmicutes bacterium]|uniref:N5-carboxyaminoimidazole ribonucleotide mutase n=1 Tax=candidate division TA06 bacterium TaxID=2250710 RepID=A0A660S7V6_UNCT6|nr:MAG: 5-(carboxyamino)imidazole ribonucleotide mutase [candidate division TA06 bacterium]HFD04823.1 5-(carboxyamino)imidazole ribonucleotide mutase [Bacillota bacterium]
MKNEILIILGSKSDLPVAEDAVKFLNSNSIPYKMEIASAHRTPNKLNAIVKNAERDGIKIIIAVAGYAAHLPGVIASKTIIPVIGVPVASSPLGGIDALFSIVQMPPGIPVATMGIGKSGVKNAVLYAMQILGIQNETYADIMKRYREGFGDIN